jgi:hypothetical protein
LRDEEEILPEGLKYLIPMVENFAEDEIIK